jgi:hypothetical protein
VLLAKEEVARRQVVGAWYQLIAFHPHRNATHRRLAARLQAVSTWHWTISNTPLVGANLTPHVAWVSLYKLLHGVGQLLISSLSFWWFQPEFDWRLPYKFSWT